MTVHDFFAKHAREFDRHIHDSIRRYDDLRRDCVRFSRDYVQKGTAVVDIGCSEGTLLRSIRDENQPSRPSVSYLGIDEKSEYGVHWRERSADNVKFEVRDARLFEFENMSLACSIFTLQFIPEHERLGLLGRIYDGLIDGGALIIAEKVFANSPKFQEMLMSSYYEHKRKSFSDAEILDKFRDLRGVMKPWGRAQLINTLHEAGFEPDDIQEFWQDHFFVAMMAQKSTPRSRPRASIIPVRAERGLTIPRIARLDFDGPELARAID